MSKNKGNARPVDATNTEAAPAATTETPAEKLDREAAEANAEAGVKPGDAAELVKPEGATGLLDGTPSHPYTVDSPEVAGLLAAMVEATEAEAKAREEAGTIITNATTNTWAILRDDTVALLVFGHKLAGEALSAYKGRCELIGGQTKARANQYTSDLRRAVKAAEKGHGLPDDLLKAGRSAWNESPFWEAVGAKKAKGPTAPDAGTLEAAAAEAGDKPATTAGEAIAEAAAAAAEKAAENDPVWRDVLVLYAKLHGPFKKEAAGRVKGLLLEIEAKMQKAGGGSK